jgi:hypothetical protein
MCPLECSEETSTCHGRTMNKYLEDGAIPSRLYNRQLVAVADWLDPEQLIVFSISMDRAARVRSATIKWIHSVFFR